MFSFVLFPRYDSFNLTSSHKMHLFSSRLSAANPCASTSKATKRAYLSMYRIVAHVSGIRRIVYRIVTHVSSSCCIVGKCIVAALFIPLTQKAHREWNPHPICWLSSWCTIVLPKNILSPKMFYALIGYRRSFTCYCKCFGSQRINPTKKYKVVLFRASFHFQKWNQMSSIVPTLFVPFFPRWALENYIF